MLETPVGGVTKGWNRSTGVSNSDPEGRLSPVKSGYEKSVIEVSMKAAIPGWKIMKTCQILYSLVAYA